jgi:hypothetical protein
VKKTGCVPDLVDTRDLMFENTETAASDPTILTENVDLRVYMPSIRDQLFQDCCWQSVVDGAYGVARVEGFPIALPSRAFPYALARLSGQPHVPLLDAGSSLRDGFRALTDLSLRAPGDVSNLGGASGGWGLIPDGLWPDDPLTVNHVPPDDCWFAGEYASIRQYSAFPDGGGTTDAAIAALRRLRFPTCCFVVDDAYGAIGSDVYREPGGKVWGSHCQLIVGYSKTLDALLLRNSWGTDFGFDGGYAWVAREFVDRFSYGHWIVELAPPSLGAGTRRRILDVAKGRS